MFNNETEYYIKKMLNKLEEEYHPLNNKNITVNFYNTGWYNILVVINICNHKVIEFNLHESEVYLCYFDSFSNLHYTDEVLKAELDKRVKQYLDRTIDEILEECYEECTMEELNEIANVWNESHSFEEWRDLEREALGI